MNTHTTVGKGVGGGVFYIPNPGFSAQLPGSGHNDCPIQQQIAILQAQALQQQASSSTMLKNNYFAV